MGTHALAQCRKRRGKLKAKANSKRSGQKVIRQYVQPTAYPEIAERYKPPPGKLMSTHIDHCIDEYVFPRQLNFD